MNSLKEIGKFRVIPVSDLAKFAYGGNRERTEKDIRALARKSLVRDKTLEISQKKTLRVVTLTKAGHRVLKNTNQVPDDQPIYHGLVKPREVKHDADLYRLYQKEAARIERAGGRPVRVLLDYELKRNLNRDLAQLGPEKDNADRKREVAEKHQPPRRQRKDSPFPICASSTKTQSSNCAMWTWNWRRATTDRAPWRQKPPRASRSMRVRKTHRVCAACSTNAKSPQESSRYEHRARPSRCPESSRIHRNRGPVSLHRSDAFRLLRGASIPRLHRCPLGQAHDHLLEQTPHQADTPGPNAFQRAERSITCSPAVCTARSTARTFAIAANTKSNTSSGASQCSILSY